MSLTTELPAHVAEVDIIVVGGGAAGCVISSRLSDADPSLSILVVESGPDNRGDPTIKHPALFMSHFQPNRYNKFYPSKESSNLNGKATAVSVGKVLGGGTSINTLGYHRPPASDFDDWQMPGWSGDDMLPYFRKFEKYRGKGEASHHGLDGPIEISEGTHTYGAAQNDLLNVADKHGWPEHRDLQSMQPNAVHGTQRSLRYISKDGVRQDAATCYLHPRLEDGKHPNLTVLLETEVAKVLVENGKATGVVYRSNNAGTNGDSPEREIRARKFVVLSAGTFGSAAILERSGIGSSEILTKAGVSVVQDLPGVGENYLDHTIALTAYRTSLADGETSDKMAQSNIGELIAQNSPLLGTNGQELNIKGRPSDAEVKALGPAFEKTWGDRLAGRPDKPLAWMVLFAGFPGYDPTLDPSYRYLGALLVTGYPLSSGYTHITGPSLTDKIDFDAGYLSDENQVDVRMLVWIYKRSRELMRRMNTFRGEVSSTHPAFPASSKAACVVAEEPLPADVADLEYTAEDDLAIEKFMRDTVATTNHSMGTCKMAPREEGGVVDSKLSVYGIQGLKVADLSIVPSMVAAHTASTALAVGEKAADLFIEELGLGLGLGK